MSSVTFDRILEGPELQECLDCGYEGLDHAERDVEGSDEADVLCPRCGSQHYYIR